MRMGETQKRQFEEMEGLYGEWNAKVNLISRRDINNLYSHHVLHSLAIASYMKANLPEDFACAVGQGLFGDSGGEMMESGEAMGRMPREGRGAEELRFLDVGTGGGFPGIPLAIMFPNAHFTLCDSIAKKTRVVADIAQRLALKNVEVVTARAEDLTGTYDYVVSRAAASLSNLLRWTSGRFDRGLFCLKGGDIAAELGEAVKKFHLDPSAVHVWGIENQLKEEYFDDKYVIFYKNFCK